MTAPPQDALETLSRGLALTLEDRPPLLARVAVATPLVDRARDVVDRLEAAVTAGDRQAAVPAQVGRQRLAGWQSALTRAVEAHAAASPSDHDLARLLTRARLVLHRYARHFGGQHRATRDLGRLVEARQDLVALLRQARPLAAVTASPALQDEARALPRFVEFLVQEQGEISDGLANAGRLDQARSLGAIAATVEDGWTHEVLPVHRLARRPGLLDRQLQSAQEVVDRMRAIRHANLPQAHEDAIETVSSWLPTWRAELDTTLAEQQHGGLERCLAAVEAQADATLERVDDEVRHGVPVDEDVASLRARCDRADELLTRLAELAEAGVSSAGAVARRDRLTDALTWLGRRYDARVAPP